MLSVANSWNYNDICGQMPVPRDLLQQIFASGQKLGWKSPRMLATFQRKSPCVRGGGVVTAKIDRIIQNIKTKVNQFQFCCSIVMADFLRLLHHYAN